MDKNIQENSDEFLRLLLPNQKRLLAYILYYIPNRSDAEDVFQNTTSILWKKFDQYKPGTDFIAWSLVITRFEIMTYFKKKKRDGKMHYDENLQGIIDSDTDTVNAQFDERIDALRECIKKLIPSDFSLLKMRYESELSFTRIGDRLGVSSAAAFKKISVIHSRLIQCIRQRIAFEEKA